MNLFKLLVAFILLFCGIFAQRFQRHLINGTQNGYINGKTEMKSLNALVSDEEIYKQEGDNVKFVGDGKEVELELKYKEFKFKFCSYGCMGKTVIACYDSKNPNLNAKGGCDPGQCEFKAGVSEGDDKKPFLWFYDKFRNNIITQNRNTCKTAIMKHPEATPYGILSFPSCEPLKHDGNVVKLYVRRVPPGCSFYIENAKIWTPPPPTPSQNSSKTDEQNQTTPKSSNAELWIGIGVGIFIIFVIIIIIGFGYYCYRTQIQKKPLFGNKKEVQPNAPESKKAEDKKEEKQQQKPAKKKLPKEKKAIVKTKPSKEVTKENATKEDVPPSVKKVSVEQTSEDPTTKASVVQKPVVQKQKSKSPRVYVPNKVILPSKKDSLSGQHEIGMQIKVESAPESLKRHCTDLLDEDANKGAKEKLENFYPPGPVCAFERKEIELFCCARISIMLKLIERLIDVAIKALQENGVTFDEHSNIIEMDFRAEKYLQSNSTPEFIRSFAFGSIFREFIDSEAKKYETFSIPLLFSVALQRRYTVFNRRKACTWIRRQLPIIRKEFSAEERSELAFPICAIEEACKMNYKGFKNVSLLDSLSGAEEDETQHSTLQKRKSAGGKKKGLKKRR